MSDITIDGKNYNYIDKCAIEDKNYIVFEDSDGIYVNEYIYENEELTFITPDLEIQQQVLEKLGIDYE